MMLFSAKRSKQIKWFALAIAVMIPVILLYSSRPAQALLGVYDPSQTFKPQTVQSIAQSPVVTLEHHFVTWRLDNAIELAQALKQTQDHQRIAMISLESWPWNWNRMTNATLLQDIVAGRYDATIDRCFKTIQTHFPQSVLLRWGHEMEMIGQYPWSVADSKAYIAAYRYLFDRAKQLGVKNILWVWSPAGNTNAVNYWPGNDVVDVVGISIYATPEWHPDGAQTLPSFARLMQQKAQAFKPWHKPVLIAEVGVNARPQQQQEWLTQAIRDLPQFPQVLGWVYFNQIQPNIVPLAIDRPDWSLNSDSAHRLVQLWPQIHPELSPAEKLDKLLSRS